MQVHDTHPVRITQPHVYLCSYREAPAREGRKNEHEAGLYLLQRGLRELAGIDCSPEDLPSLIVKTTKEKPVLTAPELPFNISHSQGMAVCAFAPEPVGVDIERVRSVRGSLPRRVLTPSEYEAYASNSSSSAALLFMRFWTLKEAYGKQTGAGVVKAMQEISFSLPGPLPENGEWIVIPSSAANLSFYQARLPGDFILSLCCSASYEAAQIRMHKISPLHTAASV